MTDKTPPCQRPENDPDDWFIGRDGKQYSDDDFLTEDEIRGISKAVLPIDGETSEQHRDRVDLAISTAEAGRKRAALQRRRHAREKCHDCYFRTNCLQRAIDEDQQHGTWGGYFEEQIRELRKKIAQRRRARRPAE